MSNCSFAQNQTTNPTHFFGQYLLELDDEVAFNQLQEDLRANPYVQVVRLDWNTKRAFILTKDIASYSEEDMRAWFGVYSNAVKCVQTGLHGVDPIKPYPFTDCNE